MKTTNQTLEHLKDRFNELEKLIEYHSAREEIEKKSHRWKNAKLHSDLGNDYNAEQREIIRIYAFIKDIEFIDACHELYQLYGEN